MKDRPTVELVILVFTVTVCAFLLLAGAGLTVLAIVDPAGAVNRKELVSALAGAVTTIIGALLGLIAGRRGDVSSKDTPTNSSS